MKTIILWPKVLPYIFLFYLLLVCSAKLNLTIFVVFKRSVFKWSLIIAITSVLTIINYLCSFYRLYNDSSNNKFLRKKLIAQKIKQLKLFNCAKNTLVCSIIYGQKNCFYFSIFYLNNKVNAKFSFVLKWKEFWNIFVHPIGIQ